MKRLPLFLLGVLAVFSLSSDDALAGTVGFTVEVTNSGATIRYNGEPVATYVIDDANKPYFFPVFGPGGKQMTRQFPMKIVAGEKQDHPHHRGITFGHMDIGGANSWAERASFDKGEKTSPKMQELMSKLGRIVHRSFQKVESDADHALLVTDNDYIGPDNKKSVTEIRRLTFRMDGDTRLIDWDQEFIATEGPVTFGDERDAGLGIRVPASMAVDAKLGGQIVTSAGKTDKEAWSTRADWVDYHGPVDGQELGIAMLNHPASFRYPTSWHVRTYGLFAANCFGTLDPKDPNGPHTLQKDERLALHHRFLFHKGDEKAADIAGAYTRYAQEKK